MNEICNSREKARKIRYINQIKIIKNRLNIIVYTLQCSTTN